MIVFLGWPFPMVTGAGKIEFDHKRVQPRHAGPGPASSLFPDRLKIGNDSRLRIGKE
jgi:hypothetical protein